MGDGDYRPYRTGFAKDCREFFLKVFSGLVLGGIAAIFMAAFLPSIHWLLWVAAGEWAIFAFAKAIRGESRFSD